MDLVLAKDLLTLPFTNLIKLPESPIFKLIIYSKLFTAPRTKNKFHKKINSR